MSATPDIISSEQNMAKVVVLKNENNLRKSVQVNDQDTKQSQIQATDVVLVSLLTKLG